MQNYRCSLAVLVHIFFHNSYCLNKTVFEYYWCNVRQNNSFPTRITSFQGAFELNNDVGDPSTLVLKGVGLKEFCVIAFPAVI